MTNGWLNAAAGIADVDDEDDFDNDERPHQFDQAAQWQTKHTLLNIEGTLQKPEKRNAD